MDQITLHGGPWNGRKIEDLGSDTITMAIAERHEPDGRTPAIGFRVGSAVYEPNKSRTAAFWLENAWEGTFRGEY